MVTNLHSLRRHIENNLEIFNYLYGFERQVFEVNVH